MSLTLDYFMDENLKLYQDKEHFRFNTDTKLLAKFVHLKKQERILDIGTNNAALLVYFDQFNVKELVGVEILEQTSKVAQKNADMFIKHPVKIVNQPIQRYEDDLFDVIVSNPPYFKMDANKVLYANHFSIRNLQFAYDHRDNQVKSVLIEAVKESSCDMKVLEPIYI